MGTNRSWNRAAMALVVGVSGACALADTHVPLALPSGPGEPLPPMLGEPAATLYHPANVLVRFKADTSRDAIAQARAARASSNTSIPTTSSRPLLRPGDHRRGREGDREPQGPIPPSCTPNPTTGASPCRRPRPTASTRSARQPCGPPPPLRAIRAQARGLPCSIPASISPTKISRSRPLRVVHQRPDGGRLPRSRHALLGHRTRTRQQPGRHRRRARMLAHDREGALQRRLGGNLGRHGWGAMGL